jgi:hypothetical protein
MAMIMMQTGSQCVCDSADRQKEGQQQPMGPLNVLGETGLQILTTAFPLVEDRLDTQASGVLFDPTSAC